MANKTYTITDWTQTDVISLKGINTVIIDNSIDVDEVAFDIDTGEEKYLKIIYSGSSLTFSNYSKLKFLRYGDDSIMDLIAACKIDNTSNTYYEEDIKGKKLTGTKYNDEIDIYLDEEVAKNNLTVNSKTGSDTISVSNGYKKTKINAGNGNNVVTTGECGSVTITSGKDADTITVEDNGEEKYSQTIKAGAGENTVVVERSGKTSITTGNDNDTISVTSDGTKTIKAGAGENTIDIEGDGKTTITGGKNKDIITLSGNSKTTTIKAGNGENDIKITNNTGKTTVTTGIDNDKIEVETSAELIIKSTNGDNTIEAYNDSAKKTTITTGKGNDTITLSGTSVGTIKAGDGENDITIEGEGSNVVRVGKDNDTITVKGGSYTDIYAGAGVNTININNKDYFGQVTVFEENKNAENKICFLSNVDGYYSFTDDRNNLIIKNEMLESSIVLSNYYKSGNKHSKYKFFIDEVGYTLEQLKEHAVSINGRGIIDGTNDNNSIIADDAVDSILISDDTITAKKGDDTINAGKGHNKLYFYDLDGKDIVYNGGGVDTLVFDKDEVIYFKSNKKDLTVYYGSVRDDYSVLENNVTIKDYFGLVDSNLKYIQIGENTPIEIKSGNTSLTRGAGVQYLKFDYNTTVQITLQNTLYGENYTYTFKSTSENGSFASVEYLANGRFVINGDYLEINAGSDQLDDIILLGSHNTLNTKDNEDIVRLGYVVDAYSNYYNFQSDYNTINTGLDKDYVIFYGVRNDITTGNLTDYVAEVVEGSLQYNEVNGSSDYSAYVHSITKNEDATTINDSISWYSQGGTEDSQTKKGGDCRLFSLLHSLSQNDGFKLSDYVDIQQKSGTTYTVEFKNYTGTNKSYDVALSKLSDFINVHGDLDVVLTDYALNELMASNKHQDELILEERYEGLKVSEQTSVQSAHYNTISNYLFGSCDTTFINYDTAQSDTGSDFSVVLANLWNEYNDGNINNITIGFPEKVTVKSDFSLGIVTGHAYCLKEFNTNYVTLINPWDSLDVLRLDTTKFYSLKPCVMVYGVDYYDQNMLIQQSDIVSGSNFDDITLNNTDELFSITQGWLTSTSDDISDIASTTPSDEVLNLAVMPEEYLNIN